MKTAKKCLVSVLAAGTLIASLALPVCAGLMQKGAVDSAKLPAGTLIYSEDFDGFTADGTDEVVKELGWTVVESITDCTMELAVSDGKLYVNNLDANSQDSYALMLDSEYMKNISNADYTYEYDVTYLSAGNTTRYVALLYNYDGKDKYDSVDMRIRGDGYLNFRRGSAWKSFSDEVCPIRATNADAIYTKLFNETLDLNKYCLQGKTVTVRVEISPENGPAVYINDVFAADMKINQNEWYNTGANAVCFKASKLIEAEIDNIRIWTGTGDAPIEAEEPTAPATFDAAVVAVVAAVSSVAVPVIARKRK